jgi:hypothetical protein
LLEILREGEQMNPCKPCWWEEGGRCYHGKPERNSKGRSVVLAEGRCKHFIHKRWVLGEVIPNDKLVIMSERRAKSNK